MAIKFDRNFLTVQEIINRWDCTELDLKHEVIEGNLVPMIFVDSPDDLPQISGRPAFFEDDGYIVDHDDLFGAEYGNRGFLYLIGPSRRGIDDCHFWMFSKTNPPDVIGAMDGGVALSAYWDKMIFSRSNIIEFEQERSEQPASEKPLTEKERGNLYNLIGVLLVALREKGMDEAAVKRFIADQGYSDLPGLSLRNLEKVFPQCRKSVP